MRLSKSRALAWIVLAACALSSVFGLGGLHLAAERSEVLDVFYHGSGDDTAPNCMDAYLNRAAECARAMVYEAQLYLGTNNAAAQRMLTSLVSVCDDNCMDARREAYIRIRQDSDALYNGIYAQTQLDGERANFKRAYDEFWRCDARMRRDPYRELAAHYNDRIARFPASAAAAIAGAGKLNTFGA